MLYIIGTNSLYGFMAEADYVFLGAAGVWGLYCLILVWRHVAQRRFRNEEQQAEFLQYVEQELRRGHYDEIIQEYEDDHRALPSMVKLALRNRDLSAEKLEDLIFDRFQYDVMVAIQDRVSWVSTIIKAAPMLGLIGTVAGMMGAFETLETATSAEPTKQLLADIRTALDHTLIGLLITVTLLIVMGTINNRIRHMEELAVFGVNRFMETFRSVMQKPSAASR